MEEECSWAGMQHTCFVLIRRGVVGILATDPYPIYYFTYLKYLQQLILKSYLKVFCDPESRMGSRDKSMGQYQGSVLFYVSHLTPLI